MTELDRLCEKMGPEGAVDSREFCVVMAQVILVDIPTVSGLRARALMEFQEWDSMKCIEHAMRMRNIVYGLGYEHENCEDPEDFDEINAFACSFVALYDPFLGDDEDLYSAAVDYFARQPNGWRKDRWAYILTMTIVGAQANKDIT